MTDPTLTVRHLNRSTLDRQMLLKRQSLPVTEAVGQAMALQAQESASPYLAMWNRVDGFDPEELDTAFSERNVVKATLMRVTLHVVRSVDYPIFHEAMSGTLRAARFYDRRFLDTGLTVADADSLIPKVVAFAAEARDKTEFEEMLRSEIGREIPEPGVWWALRQVAPLHHAPGDSTWSFGRSPSFVAAGVSKAIDHQDAIAELFVAYLRGFGPATRQDFGQFALLRQSEIEPAVNLISDRLRRFQAPDGREVLDVDDGEIADPDSPAPPRLLGMWDNVLLAHVNRTRVISDEYRSHAIRRNGDVLPTVLVDGQVVGVWRAIEAGIEVTPFHRLTNQDWDGLEDEARRLLDLIGPRDPNVYSRYRRWWDRLPEGMKKRVLA